MPELSYTDRNILNPKVRKKKRESGVTVATVVLEATAERRKSSSLFSRIAERQTVGVRAFLKLWITVGQVKNVLADESASPTNIPL